jgi:hypothetical protein
MAPTMRAYLGYTSNFDTFRGRPISRQFGKVDPEAEFDETTPKVFVRFGELSGLSPERSRYALKQYFTSGNEWTSLVAVGASRIFGQAEEQDSEEIQSEIYKRMKKWSKWPIVKKFIGETNPKWAIQKQLTDLRTRENTRRREQQMELDNKVRIFQKAAEKGDQSAAVDSFKIMSDYIKLQPAQDQARLNNRTEKLLKLEGVIDPGFWESLQFNVGNVKDRASSYVSIFNQMPKEAKAFYTTDLERVKVLNLWGYKNARAKGKINGRQVNWTFSQWTKYFRAQAVQALENEEKLKKELQ